MGIRYRRVEQRATCRAVVDQRRRKCSSNFTLIELLACRGIVPRLHGRRQVKAAFTLIELLVVIAIIAILAAILLPALKRAKDTSQKIVCLNNLKQTGIGLNVYCGEYDGYFPMRGPNDTYCWNDQICMVLKLFGYTGNDLSINRFYYKVDGVTKINFLNVPGKTKEGSIFDCPSVRYKTVYGAATLDVNRLGDYCINWNLIDPDNAAGTKQSHNIGKIKSASNTALAICAGGASSGSRRAFYYWSWSWGSRGDTAGQYHNPRQGTMLFCDGRASSLRLYPGAIPNYTSGVGFDLDIVVRPGQNLPRPMYP